MTHSMSKFSWQGTNRQGQTVKGEMTAKNISEIKYRLRRQGCSIHKIKKAPTSLFNFKQDKISPTDIAIITRQIATMLCAGVNILKTFEMIAAGQTKPSVKKMLSEIADDVRAGNPIAQSLRKYPSQFDTLYCDLVDTGEQSGRLDTIFEQLSIYKEKAEALKSKIKKAMFYPLAVVIVALMVTVTLLVFVVPQFQMIFNSFGAELPVLTQMILNLSEMIQDYAMLISVGTATAMGLYIHAYKRSIAIRHHLDRQLLKVPILGLILHKAAIARFTRTLATTMTAGVPLITALDSAANATGNAVYRDAIGSMRKEVSSGIPMFVAMGATNVFPDMVVQMIAIGEESGAIDDMLLKVTTIYEAQVDDMIDGLTSLLEPLIMTVLGLVIGGLITAMYLPIFQMGNVV